jgi:hypothetical protein
MVDSTLHRASGGRNALGGAACGATAFSRSSSELRKERTVLESSSTTQRGHLLPQPHQRQRRDALLPLGNSVVVAWQRAALRRRGEGAAVESGEGRRAVQCKLLPPLSLDFESRSCAPDRSLDKIFGFHKMCCINMHGRKLVCTSILIN